MKIFFLFFLLGTVGFSKAQIIVDVSAFDKHQGVKATVQNDLINITWPTGNKEVGNIIINLERDQPLLQSIQLSSFGKMKENGVNLDPVFF